MNLRTRAAVVATATVNALSRRLKMGSGTVAGGRLGLAIAPRALEVLSSGRTTALVSGTNGKTTTTRLLAAALEAAGSPVVSNDTGSNMPAGHFATLAGAVASAAAVLETDEGYLPATVRTLGPKVVVLLNLSRDQLDRSNEVRMVATRWREALSDISGTVVANADDPLVTFGAGSAASVIWVAGGMRWRADATGCPRCGGRIRFSGGSWSCACGFARPNPNIAVEEGPDATSTAVFADGRRIPVVLTIPGAFNRRNAVLAAAAAEVLGVPAERAIEAMGRIGEVAGRFSLRSVGGVRTRLLLAKNPAGWEELLELVAQDTAPLVIAINARIADGRDPSWLWDVPFERMAGRPIVVTGERSADLSVRLHYADLDHERVDGAIEAVARAAELGRHGDEQPVQFIGNYTAFHALLHGSPAS
ncbi:MAG: MurT ligase domain-containing protein [Acidimicrobiales bacterium]